MIFTIATRIDIKDIHKLFFAFKSDSKSGFVLRFYLLDLFNYLFIILNSFGNFQHNSGTSPIRSKVVVNLEFMWITLVSDNFLGQANYLIKMFDLKVLKIDFNIILETPILGV